MHSMCLSFHPNTLQKDGVSFSKSFSMAVNGYVRRICKRDLKVADLRLIERIGKNNYKTIYSPFMAICLVFIRYLWLLQNILQIRWSQCRCI
jgi:hypothetical protein